MVCSVIAPKQFISDGYHLSSQAEADVLTRCGSEHRRLQKSDLHRSAFPAPSSLSHGPHRKG